MRFMPDAPAVPVPSVADMALGDLINESLKLFFPVDTIPNVLPNSKYCGVMHAKLCRMKFLGLSDRSWLSDLPHGWWARLEPGRLPGQECSSWRESGSHPRLNSPPPKICAICEICGHTLPPRLDSSFRLLWPEPVEGSLPPSSIGPPLPGPLSCDSWSPRRSLGEAGYWSLRLVPYQPPFLEHPPCYERIGTSGQTARRTPARAPRSLTTEISRSALFG